MEGHASNRVRKEEVVAGRACARGKAAGERSSYEELDCGGFRPDHGGWLLRGTEAQYRFALHRRLGLEWNTGSYG